MIFTSLLTVAYVSCVEQGWFFFKQFFVVYTPAILSGFLEVPLGRRFSKNNATTVTTARADLKTGFTNGRAAANWTLPGSRIQSFLRPFAFSCNVTLSGKSADWPLWGRAWKLVGVVSNCYIGLFGGRIRLFFYTKEFIQQRRLEPQKRLRLRANGGA